MLHRALTLPGLVMIVLALSGIAAADDVPLFGMHEATFQHTGAAANPYTDLSATATLTAPDGTSRTIPLFWDGGSNWKLRFSPDQPGNWSYSIQSPDAGLSGGSGSFNVINSNQRGGITRMASSPAHFAYQDGTPMYFMGDTNWALFYNSPAASGENLNPASRKNYIDKRASQGFNAIHSQVIFGSLNNNVPSWTNAGGTAFNTDTRVFTGEALNPAFFQQLDQDVAYLNSKGITSGLVLAWAEIPTSSEHDYRDFPSAEARERYAEYVAARYSAYNVYFVVAGEWQKETGINYSILGQKLAAADPHERLITVHNWQETPSSYGTQDWAGFGEYRQVYNRLHEKMLDIRAAYPEKPGVASEYAYYLRDQQNDGFVDKPNSRNLQDIRNATWDIAMAGTYFITGFGSTYYGGMRHPTAFDSDPRDADWAEDVEHVRTLFSSLEWWNLEPADQLITATTAGGAAIDRIRPGANDNRQSDRTYWALADAGKTYVGYFRGIDGIIHIDLGDVEAATYDLKLFNPRTGQFQALAGYTGADSITLSTPSSEDWIIVASVVPEPQVMAPLLLGGMVALRRRQP